MNQYQLIKLIISYVVLFPAIGIILEYVGVEHTAYFALYGAVFSIIAESIIKSK